MPTSLETTKKLISQAKKMGRHRTKRETVEAALLEYIERRKQLHILELFNTVDYDPGYDYKAARKRK